MDSTGRRDGPQLHVWTSAGLGRRECGVWCATCGWEFRDTRAHRRNEAAAAHRCPLPRPSVSGRA